MSASGWILLPVFRTMSLFRNTINRDVIYSKQRNYRRELQRRITRENYRRELQRRITRENYRRELQRRITREN